MTTMATVDVPAAEGRDRLDELRMSAKGWHGVQLAVFGFIGLCGALRTGGGTEPTWLQQLAGAMILLALALSCAATALVAGAAWPVYGAASPGSVGDEVSRTGRRLRSGIVLTFVAVVVLALATSSSWWPSTAERNRVTVATSAGSLCGQLLESDPGTVAVEVSGRTVVLPLSDVRQVVPTTSCPD
jgi:hypothetical protein